MLNLPINASVASTSHFLNDFENESRFELLDRFGGKRKSCQLGLKVLEVLMTRILTGLFGQLNSCEFQELLEGWGAGWDQQHLWHRPDENSSRALRAMRMYPDDGT